MALIFYALFPQFEESLNLN